MLDWMEQVVLFARFTLDWGRRQGAAVPTRSISKSTRHDVP